MDDYVLYMRVIRVSLRYFNCNIDGNFFCHVRTFTPPVEQEYDFAKFLKIEYYVKCIEFTYSELGEFEVRNVKNFTVKFSKSKFV